MPYVLQFRLEKNEYNAQAKISCGYNVFNSSHVMPLWI